MYTRLMRSRSSAFMRNLARYVVVILLGVFLAGCSSTDSEPTPDPATSPSVTPTLAPGTLRVGDVVSRIDAAWPAVHSMRTTFWTESFDGGEGSPPASGTVTIEEVVVPDARSVVVLIDGVPTDEQQAVAGRIYMKGPLVPAAIAPLVDAAIWIEVDPAAATANSPLSMQVAYLLSPIESPFAGITAETAAREAVPQGEIAVGGRTCEVFEFGDPDGINSELAIDADGLPCRLVQRAGDAANVTLYEFNIAGMEISAPTVATPASEDAGS